MRHALMILSIAGLVSCLLVLNGCSGDDAQAATAAVQTTNVREYHFNITGMHCDSCVQAITTAVSNLDGVRTCTVSLELESAVISASATEDAEDRIAQAIATLGFGVASASTPTE